MAEFRLVVSGEGPTDIGTSEPGPMVEKGPMLLLIRKMLQTRGIVLKDDAITIVPKTEITKRGEAWRKNRKALRLGRKGQGKGGGYFRINARNLGEIAAESGASMAIMFRDTDVTRKSAPDHWETCCASIDLGFSDSGFERGVGMVPKHCSEAWLLCPLQDYTGCEELEDLPGNQASPNHPKKVLAGKLGERPTRHALNEIVENHCDPDRIDMSRFNRFRDRFDEVCGKL